MTRDYATEMRAVIDQTTSGGPYRPRVAAAEIVDKLRATDRELLRGWLDAQAEQFVWQAINDRDRSTRSAARHRAPRAAFGAAAEAHSTGELAGLRRFLDMPFTVSDGTRRPLAVLDRAQLLYVAESYRQRAADNSLRAVFVETLAKKVGDDTVGDHFTDDQLAAMFDSIG